MEQNLTLEEVGRVVSEHFNVPIEFITQRTRKRDVVEKRQIAHYFATIYCKKSLAAIGQHFGHRDHATVLNSRKTVQNLYDSKAINTAGTKLRDDIDTIDQILDDLNNRRAPITKAEIRAAVREAYLAYIRQKMKKLKHAEIAARDIVQLCDRITVGNISHHLNAIKGIAININQ